MAWMADDLFTIHPGWLSQYADELKRRHLQLPFECISRADRLNAKVIDTLAEMGCFRVWIGSESGSQRVLDAMERGVTIEQVQSAVTLCRSRGIQTGMFLMWGYEGEELEDIEATVQLQQLRSGVGTGLQVRPVRQRLRSRVRSARAVSRPFPVNSRKYAGSRSNGCVTLDPKRLAIRCQEGKGTDTVFLTKSSGKRGKLESSMDIG